MKKVHLVEAGSDGADRECIELPEQVQLSLLGIADSAKEG